jgi:hypothetical protein
MLATQPWQKRWPHGIVCGQRIEADGALLAVAGTHAAAVFLRLTLTHLCLWPSFQCRLWQAMEQYRDCLHLEQRLGLGGALLAASLAEIGIHCAWP